MIIIVAFIAAVALVSCVGGIVAAIVAAIASTVLVFLSQPILSLDFVGGWVLVVFSLALAGLAQWLATMSNPEKSRLRAILLASSLPATLVVLPIAYFLTTSSMFHASAYASLIGSVDTIPFATAVQRLDSTGRLVATDRTVIDQKNVRLVDSGMAERRAQDIIGKDPEFGGTYRLGMMQLTHRGTEVVWAAPLEFRGGLKWMAADPSPGYVWVDAHDSRDAALVKDIEGSPIRMRCLESAFFGSNLERLAWTRFPGIGLTDYSFEIGPKGRPYYAVTAYRHAIGFSGDDISGVVIVDPQTCATEWHGLNDIPSWVSRVVPGDMAVEQVANWASLSHGWLNLSHTDIRAVSPGIELVATSAAGETAWYMGLTTPGNPNGTTGFALVDSKTKKATYFEQAGATEERAQAAIGGAIAEKRSWGATLPILYNVGGRPTYLSVLKDWSGNFKGVGLASVEDSSLVAVGDDLSRGMLNYTSLLGKRGLMTSDASPVNVRIEVDDTIYRAASEVVNGNTVYWFTLQGRPGKVFSATNGIGPQVALAKPGDHVHLLAQGQDSGTITVLKLDDLDALKQPAPP